MAQLPPDGTWLIQQIGGQVILFKRHTEEEICRVDPSDPDAIGSAMQQIWWSELTPEQKSFACFWVGYFYAHATHDGSEI